MKCSEMEGHSWFVCVCVYMSAGMCVCVCVPVCMLMCMQGVGGQERMRSIGRRPQLAIQAVTASGGRERKKETWRGIQRQRERKAH